MKKYLVAALLLSSMSFKLYCMDANNNNAHIYQQLEQAVRALDLKQIRPLMEAKGQLTEQEYWDLVRITWNAQGKNAGVNRDGAKVSHELSKLFLQIFMLPLHVGTWLGIRDFDKSDWYRHSINPKEHPWLLRWYKGTTFTTGATAAFIGLSWLAYRYHKYYIDLAHNVCQFLETYKNQ